MCCTRCVLGVVAVAVLVPASSPALAQPQPKRADSLTDSDYRDFGHRLEKAVANGDTKSLNQLFRLLDLVEQSLVGLELLSPQEMKDFIRGASLSIERGSLAQQILENHREGGSYKVLRLRSVGKEKRLVVRLIMTTGGVNYHEFTLTRYPDGQIGVRDIHIVTSGDSLRQTIRRLAIKFIMEHHKERADRIKGADGVYTRSLPTILKMTEAFRKKRHDEVLARFKELPPELQKEKTYLLMAVGAAGNIDEKAYLSMLELFRKHYKDDPASDFVMIDYHALRGEHDRAVAMVDRLNRYVGGDPYLLVMKGAFLMEAKRYAESRTAVEKAIEEEPTLAIAYEARIGLALRQNKHDETLTWLKKTAKSGVATYDPELMKDVPEFASFLKTPEFQEYRKWLDSRKE